MDLFSLKTKIAHFLSSDQTGHGMDHLERVLDLATQFSKNHSVDAKKITLIAWLHDVDDYKLTGMQPMVNLPNAERFMKEVGVPVAMQNQVVQEILRLGFNKALEGIRPLSREGKLVSDADMCDAIGAQGLRRVLTFGAFKKQPFFLKDVFPNLTMNATTYRLQGTTHTINHFFEKLLRLKGMMLTEEGKAEAKNRHDWMVTFLKQFFEEEKQSQWNKYLMDYEQSMLQ